MTKYWVEIRPTVRRQGSPNLVPLEDIGNYVGFRSVYAYPEETAEVIKETKSTSYLRGLDVYADTLFVDFDNCTGGKLEDLLLETGIRYDKYHSGGRSIHFHIPIVPIEGAWVPAACREWVKNADPTADVSYYSYSGQFRLPGTFHSKNAGQMKELIHSHKHGGLLTIPRPPEEIMELTVTGTDEAVFIAATKHCAEGHRRPHAWRIASCAAEAGWEYERALDAVVQWNDNFCNPPHHVQDLISQCEKAYRRHNRRYG